MAAGWRERAACGGATHLFYPAGTNGRAARGDVNVLYAQAAAICSVCPVRPECLADALATEPAPRYGYRGGCTPNQRKSLAGETRAGNRAPAAVGCAA